ncbi:MAG: hypothetical protein GY795_15055 [Desulfobacterales bacterium]|nr:hypothetical protein [Desulfobacterales bacterium]
MSHEVHKDFDSALSDLTWAIGASKGQFSFILAHCNYAGLRSRVMQRIQEDARIQVVQLLPGANLFDTVFSAVEKKNPEAVVVTGLESVSRPDDILAGANQAREEFRKNFPFPLVLWITDEFMSSMIRVAPDLKSWATIVRFTFSKDDLRDFFYKCVREYTHSVLSANSDRIQSGFPIFEDDTKELDALLREALLRELPETESKSGFQADLYFLEGIRALHHASPDKAVTGFEQTLAILSLKDNPEKYGATRVCMGRARQEKGEHDKALSDFKAAVEVFENAGNYDLAGKFMLEQCLVLRQMEEWDELGKTAGKALKLNQNHFLTGVSARNYVFMALAAQQREKWEDALELGRKALDGLNQVENKSELTRYAPDRDHARLIMAKAYQVKKEPDKAAGLLFDARAEAEFEADPMLYVKILDLLRDILYDRGDYVRALEIKQEKYSLEQDFGLRAFIGADRIKASRRIRKKLTEIAPVIQSSGRREDLDRIIRRISSSDCKLLIVHGPSGVGKSSILEAGVEPALKNMSIETRRVLPVMTRSYTGWAETLWQNISIAVKPRSHVEQDNEIGVDRSQIILEKLRENDRNNFLTVLIFDQFEEFFSANLDLGERRIFYDFLDDCLDISYVKVILALRQDYLHYLLDISQYLEKRRFSIAKDTVSVLDDILCKNIRHGLENFSPNQAKALIENLAERSRFHMNTEFIDRIVYDLTSETGEVRPIELQIAGWQLETESITTLEEYKSKKELIEGFLEEVIYDCGEKNEEAFLIVLHLLTDENNTRPLRTRSELVNALTNLNFRITDDQLNLILKILTGSGLVSLVHEKHENGYQLMHDYIMEIIRKEKFSKSFNELQIKKRASELAEDHEKFVSTVSHELRTPLSSIKICIEGMFKQRYGEINEKQRDILKMALDKVNDEERIIEDLLDIFSIRKGKAKLNLEIGDIMKIVKNVIERFEHIAKRKKIELKSEMSNEYVGILFDECKIKQVVVNIVDNAIKFTPNNGTIIISVSNEGEEIETQVKDTGIGIPQTELKKIFNFNHQVDNTLSKNIKGNGIGLYIAKKYVELHKGKIWAESASNTGTTFIFTLPKRR